MPRIYTRPTGLHSRAMTRVSDALERYAPEGFTIAGSPSPNYADIVVLHVIGRDAIEVARACRERGQRYVIVQYCLKTTGASIDEWLPAWEGAELVWSYYDLIDPDCSMSSAAFREKRNFYYSPLGVTSDFYEDDTPKEPLVLTTGYVNGPGAEVIEAVWNAADNAGINFFHIGPRNVVGASRVPSAEQCAEGISESELIKLYRRATWVAALRHVEGFELPALEGCMCGAVPIMFDQPAIKRWYGDAPYYVPDVGWLHDSIRSFLAKKFSHPEPPLREALAEAHTSYLWKNIVAGFYSALASAVAR